MPSLNWIGKDAVVKHHKDVPFLPEGEGAKLSPLLGEHEGRAIYLLYNGILKDKSVFDILPPFDGPKTIFAAACRLGAPRLQREQIAFKQTLYALAV
jgi:adenine-specific DNA-methyltransferase